MTIRGLDNDFPRLEEVKIEAFKKALTWELFNKLAILGEKTL